MKVMKLLGKNLDILWDYDAICFCLFFFFKSLRLLRFLGGRLPPLPGSIFDLQYNQ